MKLYIIDSEESLLGLRPTVDSENVASDRRLIDIDPELPNHSKTNLSVGTYEDEA